MNETRDSIENTKTQGCFCLLANVVRRHKGTREKAGTTNEKKTGSTVRVRVRVRVRVIRSLTLLVGWFVG